MNALITSLDPEQLNHLFFDPPDPPTLPAERRLRIINKNVGKKYRRRKLKLESQGQADRRVRRRYRAAMVWYYNQSQDFFVRWEKLVPTMSPGSSLYDFIMQQKAADNNPVEYAKKIEVTWK